MSETEAEYGKKREREGRLRWQSRVVLGVVLFPAIGGMTLRIISRLTPATAEGLAVCAGFGLLVWLLRAATPLASVTGFLLTSCLYLSTVAQPEGSWFHTALLPGLALFVLAFAATRFRRGQKERTGLAEPRRGRSAAQVAANMGIAALAALALPPSALTLLLRHGWTYTGPILYAPLVAALAEAAADTVSSEVGQAIGGVPRMLTTLRRVPAGTDGAVTTAGTAAGFAAAGMVTLAAIPTLGLDPRQARVAWVAAICGLFADTLTGATLERRGLINNDTVNFLSTGVSALIALGWYHLS